MDIRVINTSFTPVTLQIKIESAEERQALRTLAKSHIIIQNSSSAPLIDGFLKSLEAALTRV